MSYRIRRFCSDVIFMRFVSSSFWPSSRAFIGINNISVFCLAFPNVAVGLSTALHWYFARHCCWHRNFQFSTSGFQKNIPLCCLALSSCGFSITRLCFAFFFAASNMCFQIFGHTLSGREVICFLVSLSPDHVYPSGGPSCSKKESCEACPCIWRVFFAVHVPGIFKMFLQQYIQLCLCCSGNVDVLQRNRKWFFLRHVQFDSWYTVMTINEFSCDRRRGFFWFSLKNFLFFSSYRTILG